MAMAPALGIQVGNCDGGLPFGDFLHGLFVFLLLGLHSRFRSGPGFLRRQRLADHGWNPARPTSTRPLGFDIKQDLAHFLLRRGR